MIMKNPQINQVVIPMFDQTATPFEASDQGRMCEEKLCTKQPVSAAGSQAGFIDSLKQLIQLYKVRTGNVKTVQTGGMQQFINRHLPPVQKHLPTCSNTEYSCQCSTQFQALPVPAQLEIFSYLSAEDLCRAATVSTAWADLANDDLLWRKKLERDQVKWTEVSHITNPDTYTEVSSDWSYKEIYLHCSPEVREMQRLNVFGFRALSTLIRRYMPQKPPRIAMFGPGLESSTSNLVRSIVYTDSEHFKKVKMFPGMAGGVGSGFTIQVCGCRQQLDLITLYTNTYQTRRNAAADQRLRNNRMYARGGNDAEGGEPELQQGVKDLCRTVHGFIFVVDASAGGLAVASARDELKAMVSERWSDTSLPVLVLSCTPRADDTRQPAVTVARELQLSTLSRPWKVVDCSVDSLESIARPMEWVIGQASR